ncbi:MAG: hypothetical protein ACLQDQ_11465 [Myxococcaceae bacterium]
MRALVWWLSFGLLACAHEATPLPVTPPPTSAARYFPLAVGNRWSYRATTGGSNAVEVVEIRGVQDGQYSDNKGRLLWVSPDGLRDQSRVILRSPVETGRSWTVVLGPDSMEHWRINSVGTPCNAPAGSFPDCVQVESRVSPAQDVQLVNRITFAAGVGVVSIRTTLLRNGVETPQTELLLTAYEVAPLRAPPTG